MEFHWRILTNKCTVRVCWLADLLLTSKIQYVWAIRTGNARNISCSLSPFVFFFSFLDRRKRSTYDIISKTGVRVTNIFLGFRWRNLRNPLSAVYIVFVVSNASHDIRHLPENRCEVTQWEASLNPGQPQRPGTSWVVFVHDNYGCENAGCYLASRTRTWQTRFSISISSRLW